MPTTDARAALACNRGLPLLAVVSIRVAAGVMQWVTRFQMRHALGKLEVWQLLDMGLTPEAAHTEARKVFWRA